MRRRCGNLDVMRSWRFHILKFKMVNDDAIVTSVHAESNPVDDEMDEDEDKNNESSKSPSNVDAVSALETALK
ncbi:hypothetical protein TNCV_475561 [Trichonephila clavipes]|nr:hypothetical protein TNCV_475561 [Trichonephila clavipes]